jgi:hypothetical protein
VLLHCAHCQTEFKPGQDICPRCGSGDVMVGMYSPGGFLLSGPRDAPRMRLQGRHNGGHVRWEASIGRPLIDPAMRPKVAPHIEMYNDVRWSADRHRMERREMLVDRENDYYRQEWFGLETGECTFRKEGRLSDPDMHGKSARRGKQP